MLPYLRMAGRGIVGPDYLGRFALVAALAGENAMAQHLAWRAMQMDPGQRKTLQQIVQSADERALLEFADYLRDPKPVNLDPSVFVN